MNVLGLDRPVAMCYLTDALKIDLRLTALELELSEEVSSLRLASPLLSRVLSLSLDRATLIQHLRALWE